MDRRSFITANTQSKSIGFRTNTGLFPYSPPFGNAEITHLLRRVLFGVKLTDISKVKGKNLDEVLNFLLTTDPTPDPPVNNYNNTN